MESNDSDLEGLPTEVLFKIMESLDSTKDLHTMIRSSPRFLRIFRHSPEKMIFSVLQQFLGPEAMYHAISAVKAPTINCLSDEAQKEKQLEFLDLYLVHDDQISDNFATNRADLVSLVKLTAQVRYCIEDYANFTLGELDAAAEMMDPLRYLKSTGSIIRSFLDSGRNASTNNRNDNNQAPKIYTLSATELERLQRAFFRFELFHRCSIQLDTGPRRATRESFVRKLQPWEIHEVITICNYFELSVHIAVQEAKDELRRKTWTACGRPDMSGPLMELPALGSAEGDNWNRLHANQRRNCFSDVVDACLPLSREIHLQLRDEGSSPIKGLLGFLRADISSRLCYVHILIIKYLGSPRLPLWFANTVWHANGSWRMDTRTGPHLANLGYMLWDLPELHERNLQALTQVDDFQSTLGHIFWDANRIGHGGAFLAIDDAISNRLVRPVEQPEIIPGVSRSKLRRVHVQDEILQDILMEYKPVRQRRFGTIWR